MGASKDGFLKPRVKIEKLILVEPKINYATGFNAKFIQDNKIGLGAVIKIIRSGDVIQKLKKSCYRQCYIEQVRWILLEIIKLIYC